MHAAAAPLINNYSKESAPGTLHWPPHSCSSPACQWSGPWSLQTCPCCTLGPVTHTPVIIYVSVSLCVVCPHLHTRMCAWISMRVCEHACICVHVWTSEHACVCPSLLEPYAGSRQSRDYSYDLRMCVCVLCVVCVCECVHLYVFESTLTTLCHSFCLIKLMCIGLIFFMCTVNQHSSTPPLTQQLYALHMLRPKHLDILLFPVPFLLSGILCLLT